MSKEAILSFHHARFVPTLLVAASILIFASPEAGRAQETPTFNVWLAANEGGPCIGATGAYGNAQVVNRCSTAVSIAYCNSAKCGNFESVATIPPNGYFTFSGRSVRIAACKPGLTAVVDRERSLAMCVPPKITAIRYLDDAKCFAEAIGPDRQFYIYNSCRAPRWFGFCKGIGGNCTRYDRMVLAEPGKYVPVSKGPETARYTVCDKGGKPDLNRKPPVDSAVTCRP